MTGGGFGIGIFVAALANYLCKREVQITKTRTIMRSERPKLYWGLISLLCVIIAALLIFVFVPWHG